MNRSWAIKGLQMRTARELTAVKVSCVGLDVHYASDSLSDHNVSSAIPFSHLKYSSSSYIRHIQIVYKAEIAISTFHLLA